MSVVYNVLVLGFSVGLTFDKAEAEAWLRKATALDKRIVAVPYREPEVRVTDD